jgi:hypothetical protein
MLFLNFLRSFFLLSFQISACFKIGGSGPFALFPVDVIFVLLISPHHENVTQVPVCKEKNT